MRYRTHLSVAILSLAIDIRSSVLVAADMLVIGVLIELPPFTEPLGVDADAEASLIPAAFFAAFSASRFCLEAEGGMAGRSGARSYVKTGLNLHMAGAVAMSPEAHVYGTYQAFLAHSLTGHIYVRLQDETYHVRRAFI